MTIPFLSKIFNARPAMQYSGRDYDSAVDKPSRERPASSKPRDSAESLSQATHEKLVALSRYAMRNFGIVKESSQSKALYAIGDGLKPQPRAVLTTNE